MSMVQRWSALLAWGAVVMVGVSGCGPKHVGPPTAKVSGVVTMGGKPLEGAEVHFITETFAGSVGKTNAEGRYTLPTGAAIGANKVFITKMEGGSGMDFNNPDEGMDAGQLDAMATGGGPAPGVVLPKELVPEDYSKPEKTLLKFDVPAGGTDAANFDIP